MRGCRAVSWRGWVVAALPLLCSCRSFGQGSSSSSGGHESRHSISAADLRAALDCLHLGEECTDAEVKRAFQAFAMEHHPDMKVAAASSPSLAATKASPSSATAAARSKPSNDNNKDDGSAMHRGTEAYHLLRQTSQETRRRILRESRGGGSGGGGGRFRGPFSDFAYTEAEYAKAQRIYQGSRARRRQRQRGPPGDSTGHEPHWKKRSSEDGGGGDVSDTEDFDEHTEEGRRQKARFEELKAHIAEMRRRGHRDDLPPWRVYNTSGAAATSTADFNAASASSSWSSRANTSSSTESWSSFFTSAHGRSGSQRCAGHSRSEGGGDSSEGHSSSSSSSTAGGGSRGPRNPERLGLRFFHSTAAHLKEVRDLYRSRPGFAGMDGSSYDNPASAARVAPELSANPHLRQYILMKHRAQEKALVDRAVRQPLLLFLLMVVAVVTSLITWRMAQLYSVRTRQDEEVRRRDEERGGA